METKTGSPLTNYLDDFLFYALSLCWCNFLLSEFIRICNLIGFPIAEDKTEWGTTVIVFLGILLDGINWVLSIPLEKRDRAEYLLKYMIDKKKVMVKDLQNLCGNLNFLCKAIYPGRTFTHRMYAKFAGLSNSHNLPIAVFSKLKAVPSYTT